jgi:hypothetical protein
MPKNERPKAAPVAYAKYESKGENVQRAEAYVRPSAHKEGWFTFENSFDEDDHGTKSKIVKRFIDFDRSLTMRGFVRVNAFCADKDFSL